MRKYSIIIFLLFFTTAIIARAGDVQGIRYGFKVPYSYDLSYYKRLNHDFAFYGGIQLTSIPFQNSSIKIMELWGGDVKIASILEEPYVMGAGLDLGYNFYPWKNSNFYFTAAIQWMDLVKTDIDDILINDALDVDISKYPEGPIPKSLSQNPLTINSHYLNFALGVGKSLNVKTSKFYIVNLEFQISKTLASNHFLDSDYRYLTPVSNRASQELKNLYLKYGWFPLLNIYFIRLF